jgi:hypothetical protein
MTIAVTVSAPFTARNLTIVERIARAVGEDATITLTPACGEPLSSPLGPLPSCCLPAGHDGDHDPYGRDS